MACVEALGAIGGMYVRYAVIGTMPFISDIYMQCNFNFSLPVVTYICQWYISHRTNVASNFYMKYICDIPLVLLIPLFGILVFLFS